MTKDEMKAHRATFKHCTSCNNTLPLGRQGDRCERCTCIEQPCSYKLNTNRSVAVSTLNYYMPMDNDTPRGVKLILMGAGGVAHLGTWDGKDKFWIGWFPLPRLNK